METKNATDPILTIIHTGSAIFDETDNSEIEVVIEDGGAKQKVTDNKITIPNKEHDKEEKKEDDQQSVIIEEVENKTIEIEEDSAEEELPLTLDHGIGELSNVATDAFAKATEFVVVNTANLSTETAGETDTTNRYAVEDIQIKDELAENIAADINSNDVLENDPMGLLELNNRSDCTSSTRSQDDTDYGDDVSSMGSSSVNTGTSSAISIFDWIKDYPWLLYEEGNEPFGYCLYCDAKLNIKSQRSVKQHGVSLYHKERCENYIAFRDEEEKNGLSMKLVEIKEEFGTDSRVEALKLKRKSQSGALNNFNWRRWLEDYPWLKRDSAEGTVGYCKYCLIHVNVEFSYLRDRHQEGSKHKEAEKQYEESNKSIEPNLQVNQSNFNEEKKKEPNAEKSQTKKWLEIVKNEPLMARCKVCRTKMFKNNFLRHLRTNLHDQNEKTYLQNQAAKQKSLDEDSVKKAHDWKAYATQHPWLVPDPKEPALAYCKYCEKRIVYGASAAKRAVHENSSQHKQNESEFKKLSRKDTDKNIDQENDEVGRSDDDGEQQQEEDEEEENQKENDVEAENSEETNDDGEGDDEGEEEDEEEEEEEEEEDEEEEEEEDKEKADEDEKESEDENDSKKRVYRLSDEWINQYPWCKRYNKNPTNFYYCIYCKIPLKVSCSRSKHQNASFHITSEKEFLNRQAKRQKQQEKKQNNENAPFFEWAIHLKNNPSSYSCRYCRVRISKNYSKKQHASSKIHQINESIYKNNRRKSLRNDENTNSNASQTTPKVITQLANAATTKKVQTFAKVVIKAPSTVTLIKQWQKKFPWLSYKRTELRSNYGHCKICESSLYIRSLKHVLRHLRSQRHTSTLKAQKKQKVEKDLEDGDDAGNLSNNLVASGPKEELQTSPPASSAATQNQTKPVMTIANENAVTIETPESPKAYNYKSTISEMKKRFSWIEKSERPNYVYCRFCNVDIALKILLLRSHSNSQKHRQCVVNYRDINRRGVNGEYWNRTNTHSAGNNDYGKNEGNGADDDEIMIVEENNEEILISEQDENWTVKSETMDEHEELDYLLQRSFTNSKNKLNTQRNVRKSVGGADSDPPAKRIKRSQSFKRLNDSSTSLVASLLTTPLTLASCLGPLIQQQIQQQANISQSALGNASLPTATAPVVQQTTSVPPTVEPENTYDLFFKSISETMKKLPVDLAAEGKLRVMQIICDLELQALKRQQSSRNESTYSNTSGGSCGASSYQPTSTSAVAQPSCNSSVINETIAEQNENGNGNGNETIITQMALPTDVSPPSVNHAVTPITTPTTSSGVEKSVTSTNSTSPTIGVMDKNGLQTLQWRKTAVTKQVARNAPNTTITTVANTGIRCIPFKNLSQNATAETPPNTKITRIQVPMNVTTQSPTPNVNAVETSKNLINFRNIQITKRISTPPNPTTAASSVLPHQQIASQGSTIVNNSPQRTYITNIQPQLQRWGCSVNGSTTHQTPTSSTVSHLQQTSTPISKKH